MQLENKEYNEELEEDEEEVIFVWIATIRKVSGPILLFLSRNSVSGRRLPNVDAVGGLRSARRRTTRFLDQYLFKGRAQCRLGVGFVDFGHITS